MAAQSLYKLPTFVSALNPNQTTKLDSTITLNLSRLHNPWLGSNSLFLQSSNLGVRTPLPKLRFSSSTTLSQLPTTNREIDSSTVEVPKWSSRAIRSFAMAELEARKLKYPTTGTEALIMGILVEGTSLASKFLRANGITLFNVREETIKLLGKADMYFHSPEHPPLAEGAQKVLDWAFEKKLQSGDSGEITTSHLLLGIWNQVEYPGHKIMATLGFNDDKAKELETLSFKPGFLDG